MSEKGLSYLQVLLVTEMELLVFPLCLLIKMGTYLVLQMSEQRN